MFRCRLLALLFLPATLLLAANQPAVSLSTTALVFPPQPIGTTSNQILTITNTGTAPLTIRAVLGASSTFFASSRQGCLYEEPVQPGGTCAVTVIFNAQAAQANDTITLYDNAPSSPQTITLTGYGTPALNLTGSNSEVNFLAQNVLTQSAVQNLVIYNYTTVEVTDINLAVTGANPADFFAANNCPSTLAPNASCTAVLSFFPQLTGTRTASLTVTSNLSPVNFPLIGPGSIDGGVYEIVNGLTGKALDLAGAALLDGTRIQQNTLSGAPQQQWRLINNNDGFYRIINFASAKALDVMAQSIANGAPLQLYDYLSGANQEWQFVPVDDVHYEIVNRLSGKVLDVTGASSADGTSIQQWDYLANPQQSWILVPAFTYHITNILSTNALDIAQGSDLNGAGIEQSSPNGQKQQQWQLIPTGGGYYSIFDLQTGKVLDVTGESTSDGAAIQQWDYLGGANQQWQILPVSFVTTPTTPFHFAQSAFNFKIVNRLSGKVLDDTASSFTSGTGIQQWDYLATPNQQWQLTPIAAYSIASLSDQSVLDVPGGSTADGTDIQQWTANGNLQQQWTIVPVAGSYAIFNSLTGKALEVSGASTADGALIDQSTFTAADNQLWLITSGTLPVGVTPYVFTITNRHSGKVLDVTGSSPANGTLIQQWDNLYGYNQQWLLTPYFQ